MALTKDIVGVFVDRASASTGQEKTKSDKTQDAGGDRGSEKCEGASRQE